MKKITVMACGFLMLLGSCAFGMDFEIFDMRNKIFEESKAVKAMMPHSPDAVVLINLFDSCLITMNQLDAYFVMLTIFDTIKKGDLAPQTVNSMIGWLNEIKRSDETNISNFTAILPQVNEKSKSEILAITKLLDSLNSAIVAETNKLNIILKSLQIKPKKK